eukprot:2397924-Rhodomonas_salina.1
METGEFVPGVEGIAVDFARGACPVRGAGVVYAAVLTHSTLPSASAPFVRRPSALVSPAICLRVRHAVSVADYPTLTDHMLLRGARRYYYATPGTNAPYVPGSARGGAAAVSQVRPAPRLEPELRQSRGASAPLGIRAAKRTA